MFWYRNIRWFQQFLIVLIEGYLRSLTKEEIPIVVNDKIDVYASAYKKKDFLWLGYSWSIKVNSKKITKSILNSEWTAILDEGENVIYYNHDSSNTDQYSTLYNKVPKLIKIEAVERPVPDVD